MCINFGAAQVEVVDDYDVNDAMRGSQREGRRIAERQCTRGEGYGRGAPGGRGTWLDINNSIAPILDRKSVV